MNDDNVEFYVGVVLAAIVTFALTFYLLNYAWKSDSIDRGFAYYHPTTGNFTWKTNMVEINK